MGETQREKEVIHQPSRGSHGKPVSSSSRPQGSKNYSTLRGHTCQEASVCGAEPRSTMEVELRCGLYPVELPACRPTPHKGCLWNQPGAYSG